MAKRTTFSNADMRPRIHVRLRGDTVEAAAIGCGPWSPITDIIDAIDQVAGEGAYREPAVIIWEGEA